MLTLAATFPSGRYHATPWGAHVNEGATEWPPSPWRIFRALVAVGFTRLGWRVVPGDVRALLGRLADVEPTYALPPARAAHSRHYMPLYAQKTTKVIDAFGYVGDGTLAISFPIDLSPAEIAIIDELVAVLPYLGRAESWVELRRVDAVPDGLAPCVASSVPPGPRYERIELLAPERPAIYATWREEALRRELDVREREEREKTAAKSKPWRGLAKKDVAKVEELFPASIVDAMLVDTTTLQRAGWSQPPGTRWLAYQRPVGALAATTPASSVRRPRRDFADTALLGLSSDSIRDVLPSFAQALRRLEVLHDALVKESEGEGGEPSPCFTGRVDGEALQGHRHAMLVPLSLGVRRDRMDHVLVYAPMGFDDRARDALGRVRKTYAKKLPDLFVTLVGIGKRDEFERVASVTRSARRWESRTPYVASRHLKERGNNTLHGQVLAELAWRNQPPPTSIHIELADGSFVELRPGSVPLDRLSTRFRMHVRERASRPAPSRQAFSLRLEFAEPIRGPLSLGYASHFGLGSFEPK